ncbi:MAG TPA: DNA primase [Burkholderiaceae bacterium]|nr:DNA primase [Burkholderiaceae bacterium]HSB99122.1 DNA primase [Burkholderiaceae bacterium]
MLPHGFVQELLSRVDILEVIGRHVELKRAGSVHKGLCPFHGEKTPSFTVSPTRQTYHCFGCGAHGDAIRFLMENQGLPFMDAVRELAQRVGIAVPDDAASPEERARAAEQRAKRQTLSDVLSRAAEHYKASLKVSPRAIDYLKGRGLTGEIAARFGLGYAPPGWRSLASVFPRYDDPLLVEAGLVIVQGEDGAEDQKRYDRFRDRIMFPIRSVRGEVIGFGGRVLDEGEPKYLNSPETPLFVKGRELYGLYEARTALREAGYALVVEGYMDVVALAQSGFAHAVATLGTACTAEHVAKLLRFTDHVVFSFDGDAAGRRAAARALEAALPHASDLRTIRFLFLPPEHDPDSFVRERGAAAFEQQVAAALPLSRMLLQTAQDGCDLSLAEGRARMLAQARPMIAALPAGALREQVLAELAQAGGTSAEQLRALWGAVRAARPAARSSAAPRRAAATRQAATLLDRAVWLLLQRCGLWEQIAAEDHERLAAQAAPYGSFFGLLERCLHDQGVLSRSGLIDWLRHAAADDANLMALLDRSSALHDLDGEVDALHDLRRLLLRLQLEEVKGERKLLAESGQLSGAALTRYRELDKRQGELSAALASGDAASSPQRAGRF